jgi:glycosyltransferase involved in cell wall biosynthesis
VIITLNEERHIRACIESMLPIVDEVLVVDSFSTDSTPAICRELGVRFLQHPFAGYIEQKNIALQHATYDHVLALDADERVSATMASSIAHVKANWTADGYAFNRLNNYCGVWLRHAWYPDRKVRLWDRRLAQWSGVNPHDRVSLPGQVTLLEGDILHFAYQHIAEHVDQIGRFARIAAAAKYKQGTSVHFFGQVVLGPWFKFFKLYILKRGFMDGAYGFVFCCLASTLNFLKYAQLWALYRQPPQNHST